MLLARSSRNSSQVLTRVHTNLRTQKQIYARFSKGNTFYSVTCTNNRHSFHTETTNETSTDATILSLQKEQLTIAYNLFGQKKFLDSYNLFVQAIDSFEQLFALKDMLKEDEHLLAIGYNNLAETLRFMLKSGYHSPVHPKYSFATIVKLYNKAEEIWSKYTNDNEVDYWRGTLFNNLGLYYMESARNHPAALTQFLKSSEIRKSLLDRLVETSATENTQIDLSELRSHLAVTFNNIGQCYVNLRQVKQAIPFFENAKYLFDQRDVTDNASTRIYVVVLNNIGLTFFEMSKYNDALDHFFKAIQVLSKGKVSELSESAMLQTEDIEYLMSEVGAGEELGVTLNNIGTVLYMKSKFDLAEAYLRQSLSVFEKVFMESPNHKHIATTCTQLALTLREKHSKMPKPEKEMLKQNAASVLSKMGWNPFKKEKEVKVEDIPVEELTPEQRDYQESRELLERARKIANIHQHEHELMEKRKKEEQQMKDANAKKFKGTSMFSRMLSRK